MSVVDNITILGVALGYDTYYPKDYPKLRDNFNDFIAVVTYNKYIIESDLQASGYTCFDEFVQV